MHTKICIKYFVVFLLQEKVELFSLNKKTGVRFTTNKGNEYTLYNPYGRNKNFGLDIIEKYTNKVYYRQWKLTIFDNLNLKKL